MKSFILCLVTLVGVSHITHAHGEDKLGPHGGFIRMPGAFHTEVIPMGKDKLKVYLLDIDWQNPSLKDASLDIQMDKKGRATCSAQDGSYFLCMLPKGSDLSQKGQLKVKAQREGQVGNEVTYELPLKLQVIDDGHGGH